MSESPENNADASVRAASRWLRISALTDALPLVLLAFASIVMSENGVNPGFFIMLLLAFSVFVAVVVAGAVWKMRAGRLLRQAECEGDGEVFASAFVPLRRYFMLLFVVSSLTTATTLLGAC